MKPKTSFRCFLALAGSSLLAVSCASAAIRTWGGGNLDWTNTTASGWNAAVPVGADTANIGSGTVTVTTTITTANTPGAINLTGGMLVISTGKLVSGLWTNGKTFTVGSSGTLRLNSWGYDVAGSLGALDYGRARLVVNGGVIEVIGNSTNSGRNFTVGTGGATLRSSVNSGQTWTLNRDGNSLYHDIQVNGGLTLTLDGTGNGRIENNLVTTSGTGNIAKSGAGTWTIAAPCTYNGATTISGGKLTIDSTGTINSTSGVSIGAGEFNYNSSTALSKGVSFSGTGGTLSGNGTITPTVNVTTGNTLAIGNSIGAMNFGGNLTVAGTYLYELTGGSTTADLGDVAGNLTLGGILDLVQLGTYTVGNKFTLFAYDGALSGVFKDFGGVTNILDDTTFTDADGLWMINYNDTTAGLNGGTGTAFVTITAIPEPGAVLLGGLGILLILRRRR